MTTYEILDKIADSYNPLLFIAYLVFAVIYFRAGDKFAWLKGFAGIIVAYAIMFLDKSTHLWESVSLDYSTHSAVALVLIVFHLHKRPLKSPAAVGFSVSLLAYYCLEVYQKYHTIADIVSTFVVVAPLAILIYWLLDKLSSEKSPPTL